MEVLPPPELDEPESAEDMALKWLADLARVRAVEQKIVATRAEWAQRLLQSRDIDQVGAAIQTTAQWLLDARKKWAGGPAMHHVEQHVGGLVADATQFVPSTSTLLLVAAEQKHAMTIEVALCVLHVAMVLHWLGLTERDSASHLHSHLVLQHLLVPIKARVTDLLVRMGAHAKRWGPIGHAGLVSMDEALARIMRDWTTPASNIFDAPAIVAYMGLVETGHAFLFVPQREPGRLHVPPTS